MSGWIKLHRSILEWEWYSDKNTKSVFIHLLLTANIENKKWHGIEILRGQSFTSIQSLSKDLKLTSKQTRNCLTKLKSSGEIGIQGASNGTMITICNYESYQDIEKQKVKQTDKQGANKGQLLKKDKEEKKEYISPSDLFFSDIEKVLLNDEKMKIFRQWSNEIISKCSRIWEMPKPITSFEFYQLINSFGKDMVFNKLLALSNRTDLVKRHSAYLTVLNWCEKDRKDQK